jgi:hypothetical protein
MATGRRKGDTIPHKAALVGARQVATAINRALEQAVAERYGLGQAS